ncbi:MAG: alpha-glucan family phosphorylase, partial [Acidimicrobiales bacterium]|nr:alpha-glucan family phosphorylase [Acidimicrobiales bacterium]
QMCIRDRFTTHTPVPAGIDRFPRELMERYFTNWCREVGIPFDELMEIGHEPGTAEGEVFNMAVMSLRLAGQTNAVSKLHAKVSRQMFAAVWPDLPVEEVPIRPVTNGVHAQTWASREMVDLFQRHLGSDWAEAPAERWGTLASVPPSEIWTVRRINRERLVRYVRRRLRQIGLAKGMSESQVAWADDVLDPAVLTIGFARRFATYKRANLILRDVERFTRLLLNEERPVQLIIAGKAHPADEPGKQLLQAVANASADLDTRHRLIFLEDYDIAMAKVLIAGVDVWLNNPIRPMEACGTSGMKAALNGVLNCSILDGWWDEMFEPDIGWAIPSAEWQDDPALRDDIEANGLYNLLEKQIVPLFYERDGDGLPIRWIERIKRMLVQLGPKVQATRMLRDYTEAFYEPAAERSEHLAADDYARAKALVRWKRYIFRAWPSVTVQSTAVEPTGTNGDAYRFSAQVTLGDLEPSDVDVQLVYGSANPDDELIDPQIVSMTDKGSTDHPGWHRYEAEVEFTRAGNFGFTVRIVPSHPDLLSYTHLARVAWAPSPTRPTLH